MKSAAFVANTAFRDIFDGVETEVIENLTRGLHAVETDTSGVVMDIDAPNQARRFRFTTRSGPGIFHGWAFARATDVSDLAQSRERLAALDAERDPMVRAQRRSVTDDHQLNCNLQNERRLFDRAQQIGRIGHFRHDLRTDLITGSDVLLDILGLNPADAPFAFADLAPRLFDSELLEASVIHGGIIGHANGGNGPSVSG